MRCRMKEVLFVILNDFAEWEATPLSSAINQTEGFRVKTVSITKEAIKSIGGFTVIPDYTLSECIKKEFCGVILVGGKSWRTDDAKQVSVLVDEALKRSAVIAGICDASVYLGTMGLLNNIYHTSNTLEDLQSYIGEKYTGAKYYKNQQAVKSKNIITANGTANLEFAKEVLLALDVMPPQAVEQWYKFYKLGYYEAGEKSE